MRCIICSKKIPKDEEICNGCNMFMDMAYKNNPKDREFTLNIFREEHKKEEKKNEN